MNFILFYAALAVIISIVFAQTTPGCHGLTKTCRSNNGTIETNLSYDFTQSSDLNEWTTIDGAVVTSLDGAEFPIYRQGDAPSIVTDFYIFHGKVSVEMRASNGTAIVSSVSMLSDNQDEINWEVFSSLNDKLQTDYFGKDDNSDYNHWARQLVMTPPEVFHNYTWIWSKDKLSWAIDGNVVRTINYAGAKGGSRYPQTPMRIRIGSWAAGDPSRIKGSIDWAGEEIDYSETPFTMYVKSVQIVNYNPAKSYSYSDNFGTAIFGSTPSTFRTVIARSSAQMVSSTKPDTPIATDHIATDHIATSFIRLDTTQTSSSPAELTTNDVTLAGALPENSPSDPLDTFMGSRSTSNATSVVTSIPSLVADGSTGIPAGSAPVSAVVRVQRPVNITGMIWAMIYICVAFHVWTSTLWGTGRRRN